MAYDVQITFDCADPGELAMFWAEVLGYEHAPPPEGFGSWDAALEAWNVPQELRNSKAAIVDPEGRRPRVFFQRVPEGKSAKNRVHLDVRAAVGLRDAERMAELERHCERLVALGATRVKRWEPDGPEIGFIVMLDPEGNEFCLD